MPHLLASKLEVVACEAGHIRFWRLLNAALGARYVNFLADEGEAGVRSAYGGERHPPAEPQGAL